MLSLYKASNNFKNFKKVLHCEKIGTTHIKLNVVVSINRYFKDIKKFVSHKVISLRVNCNIYFNLGLFF